MRVPQIDISVDLGYGGKPKSSVVEDLELSHLVKKRPKNSEGRCAWRFRQSCLSRNRLLVSNVREGHRFHSCALLYIVRVNL